MAFESRTHLKICGITRLEDALLASSLGVDAIGFVFYKKSPRYISPESANEILKQLPPFMSVVGLFVDPTQEHIDVTLGLCPLDVIQLHGEESPEFCLSQDCRVIKALPIFKSQDLERIADYACTVLLDAKAPAGVYGGTGVTFDWSILTNLKHAFPLMLAGGIGADNIGEAMAIRDWYALDVSSGVELSKGIKDSAKMKALCAKLIRLESKETI